MSDFDKTKDLQRLEQGFATLGDIYPPLWRRMYGNCISEGFSEMQAMELVKTWILSQGSGGARA